MASRTCTPLAQVHARSHPYAGLPLSCKSHLPVQTAVHPPAAVDVVGSAILGTAIAAHADGSPAPLAVDLAVTLHADTAAADDRKHFLWHDKAVLFLRALASWLVKAGWQVKVGVSGHQVYAPQLIISRPEAPHSSMKWDAPSLPSSKPGAALSSLTAAALDVKLSKPGSRQAPLEVRVFARPPAELWAARLLRPGWNNSHRYTHAGTPQPATALYNARLAAGCAQSLSLQAVHAVFTAVPAAKAAAVALKWVVRRTLRAPAADSWSGWDLTVLTAVAAQQGIVRADMRPIQAARALLTWLAMSDLTDKAWWCRPAASAVEHDEADDNASVDSDELSDDEAGSGVLDSDEEEREDDDDGGSGEDTDGEEELSEDDCQSSEGDVSDSDAESDASSTASSVRPASLWDMRTLPADLVAEHKAHSAVVLLSPDLTTNLLAHISAPACAHLRRVAGQAAAAMGGAPTPLLRTVLGPRDPEAANDKAASGPALAAAHSAAFNATPSALFAMLWSSPRDEVRSWDHVSTIDLPCGPIPEAAVPAVVAGADAAIPCSTKANKLAAQAAELTDLAEHTAAALTTQDLGTANSGAVLLNVANALTQNAWHDVAAQHMQDILARGVGPRCELLRVVPSWGATEWALETSAPRPVSLAVLALLRPMAATRLVERGAAATQPELAAEFDDFWGELAHTRRFADGAILQAVVWESPLAGRTSLVHRAVQHLASRHLLAWPAAVSTLAAAGLVRPDYSGPAEPEAPASVRSPGLALEALLEEVAITAHGADATALASQPELAWAQPPAVTLPEKASTHWLRSAGAAATQASTAFAGVVDVLKSLSGLSLAVHTVVPTGAGLRGSSVHAPAPHPLLFDAGAASEYVTLAGGDATCAAQIVPTHSAVVTMQSSGKWPSDLRGMSAVRLALLSRMQRLLSNQSNMCALLRVPTTLQQAMARAAPGTAGGNLPGVKHGSNLALDDSDPASWMPQLIIGAGGYAFKLWLFHPPELAALVKAAGGGPAAVLGSTSLLQEFGALFTEELAQSAWYVSAGAMLGRVVPGQKRKRAPDPAKDAEEGWVTVGADGEPLSADATVAAAAAAAAARAASDMFEVNPKQALARARALFRTCVADARHATDMAATANAHPSFAPTVRLACRWLAHAGLLEGSGWPVQAVELTVAALYCGGMPGVEPPANASTAFMLWLELMGHFAWDKAPLLVDVNGASAPSDASSLGTQFAAAKRNTAGTASAVAYIVTPHDRGMWRPLWTEAGPCQQVVARTAWCARQAAQAGSASWHSALGSSMPAAAAQAVVAQHGELPRGVQPRPVGSALLAAMFHAHRAAEYPAAIELRPAVLRRADGVWHGAPVLDVLSLRSSELGSAGSVPLYKNMQAASRAALLFDLDPTAALLAQLRASTGKRALFFADASGAVPLIGVVWRGTSWTAQPAEALAGVAAAALSAREKSGKKQKQRAAPVDEALAAAAGQALGSVSAWHRSGAGIIKRINISQSVSS